MITSLGAAALARAIREREVSATEAVTAHVERVGALAELNAVVVPRFEAALEDARRADQMLRGSRPVGPLHGVPITVKEAIALGGLPWTNASRLTEDVVAERDGAAVRRLRAAGAIPIGKTNIPEFCAFYDTDNEVYGRTPNPHGRERTPGGSSGGEAAALAARLTPLGVGSDLASSIRQPAAWCGVFGLKPTRGAVPLDGHAGFGLPLGWQSFGAIGPMARHAEDLDLALSVMVGAQGPAPARRPARIAVYEEDGLQGVARVCRGAVRAAAAALADAGYDLVDAAPPALAEARPVFDTILATETAVFGLPALQGQEARLSRYGRRFADSFAGLAPDLDRYLRAGVRLAELEAQADEWFERHPIAVCPVVPVTAPLAAQGIALIDGEPARPGGKLTLCTYASAVGLPAASVPFGRDADGLPLAVQVTGARGSDRTVLAVARVLEDLGGGAVLPQDPWYEPA